MLEIKGGLEVEGDGDGYIAKGQEGWNGLQRLTMSARGHLVDRCVFLLQSNCFRMFSAICCIGGHDPKGVSSGFVGVCSVKDGWI